MKKAKRTRKPATTATVLECVCTIIEQAEAARRKFPKNSKILKVAARAIREATAIIRECAAPATA